MKICKKQGFSYELCVRIRKKLSENWKSLHNLVLLVGFLIFRVLVSQLVPQKNQKQEVRFFFRLQNRDYMYNNI